MSTQQNSKFNSEQYAMILNFLEDPQNKAMIFGVSGNMEVGVAPPRKIEAWKELAALINTKFKGKYKLDHKSMADRWRTYFNKYKAARERSSANSFGVTDDDKRQNIHTVQEKLDTMCPHYDRMHALVGERPNVSPAAIFDSGSICPGTDLNELLRFTAEESPNILDDNPAIGIDEILGPFECAATANKEAQNDNVVIESPSSFLNQATGWPEPEDDDAFPTDLDASPMVATGTKHPGKFENSDGKKSKKDRRKDLPSLSGKQNPTQTRNQLAQTIQDCASAKAAALVTIEEKRLKFEQLKWETEREEREIRRREDKEEERLRRDEDNAKQFKERKFALLQTMVAAGKSTDEIKDILAMLS